LEHGWKLDGLERLGKLRIHGSEFMDFRVGSARCADRTPPRGVPTNNISVRKSINRRLVLLVTESEEKIHRETLHPDGVG